MSKVRGQFREFEGTLTVAADDPPGVRRSRRPSTSARSTRATSDRDDHLRSGDFFSVETIDDDLQLDRRPTRTAAAWWPPAT